MWTWVIDLLAARARGAGRERPRPERTGRGPRVYRGANDARGELPRAGGTSGGGGRALSLVGMEMKTLSRLDAGLYALAHRTQHRARAT